MPRHALLLTIDSSKRVSSRAKTGRLNRNSFADLYTAQSHTAMPLKCHCPATDLPFWYFYPALGFHLALAIPVSYFDIYICDHGLGTRTEPQGSERGQCFHLALFVVRFGGEHWKNCPVWAFSPYAVGTAICYRLRQRRGGVRRWFSLLL